MRGAGNRARTTQTPGQPILADYEIFCNLFFDRVSSELEKKGSEIFHSWPRMKVELTRENGKNTSNMEAKGYV